MQNGNEGLQSITLVNRGLLVKMLVILKCKVYFTKSLYTNTFQHVLDTGMQNGD